MTALARASSNCKQQTHPLVREGAPHQQTHNCLTVTKSGLGPQMGLDTKTDWPTDCQSYRKFDFDFDIISCEIGAGQQGPGPWSTQAEEFTALRVLPGNNR
jgi:hypothetical protein